MMSTAIPAAGKCAVSKIQTQLGWYSTQSGNRRRAERPGCGQRPKMLVRQKKHPPHRGWRDPHPVEVGAAVGQLAVAAVGLPPFVEQRQDLAFFLWQQSVHRLPARSSSSSRPALVAASTRCGTRPLSPNRLFPRLA